MQGGVAHFPPADLARFADAPDPSSPRWATVYYHLQSGCELCATLVARCRRLSREIPFPRGIAPGWILPRRVLLAPPVDDAAPTSLHLTCVAPPYELDLLLGVSDARVTGQVTLSGRKYAPVPGLPLERVALGAATTIAEAFTDHFGEFDIAGTLAGCWGLRLGRDPDAPTVLVWDGIPP